jgi:hypothetical protein
MMLLVIETGYGGGHNTVAGKATPAERQLLKVSGRCAQGKYLSSARRMENGESPGKGESLVVFRVPLDR